MNRNQNENEILKIICLIAVLAGLLFAITAWAQTPATESTTPGVAEAEADMSAAEQAADPSVTGNRDKSMWQKRQAQRRARADARRQKLVARMQPAAQTQTASVGPLKDLTVSFKLDPRVLGGTYGGERWVSPRTYTQVQDGNNLTVAIRAQGLDAKGQSVDISPKWIASEPDMVTVAPSQGKAFVITVHRAGESSLTLTSQGVSKTLAIKATAPKDNVLQVEISQKG
jgi:hypothetical protein